MPSKTNLSDRHQNILKATIKHYIATAEPVGSKTLVEEYDLTVSSATIRNVMGRLEKAGLLYQPHTSAGRIPSDSGYRIYVDQLITPDKNLSLKIEKTFKKQLKSESWSLEFFLQKAANILASLSGYIALVTMPQTANNQLHHLQLVQVGQKQVMLIIVTNAYQTQSVLIDSEYEQLSLEELEILSNFLNSKLKGRLISELATLDWSELDKELKNYANFGKILLKTLNQVSENSTSPMMISGVAEVLRQPEFSQLEAVQMLIHLLEQEQEQLWPLIFQLPKLEKPTPGVKITIGSENPLEPMRPCTLISSLYRQGKVPVGSIAIIGPTRMLYENAIPLVEATADYISDVLS